MESPIEKSEKENSSSMISFGLAISPDGKNTVSMNMGDESWLHFHNFRPLEVRQVRKLLKEHNVETKIGLAINVPESISRKQVVILDEVDNPKMGIYVKSEVWDTVETGKVFGLLRFSE